MKSILLRRDEGPRVCEGVPEIRLEGGVGLPAKTIYGELIGRFRMDARSPDLTAVYRLPEWVQDQLCKTSYEAAKLRVDPEQYEAWRNGSWF